MLYYAGGMIAGFIYLVKKLSKVNVLNRANAKLLEEREYKEVEDRKTYYIYYLSIIILCAVMFLKELHEKNGFWVALAIFLAIAFLAEMATVHPHFTLYDMGTSFVYMGKEYAYKDVKKPVETKGVFKKRVHLKNDAVDIFKRGRLFLSQKKGK